MSEPIICLQCGGLVEGGDPSDQRCSCPPPSEAGRITCPGCGGALRVGARACPYCNSTIATCRCPACLAWNLADAQHCQACGHSMSGHTHDQGSLLDIDCPRCAARLHVRKYAELDVDECDQCGGLFISPKMLDAIVDSRDKPKGLQLALPKRVYKRETEVRYIHCPQCRTVMNRKMFGRISGVIVDVCKDHGVWFDAGELNEVLEWVSRGGLEMARDKEKLELQEQVRSLRSQQMAAVMHQPMVDDHPGMRLGTFHVDARVGSEIVAAFVELWHDLK